MTETSPLLRAEEQPPCDSRAESVCLNGVFAVPARMAHFDVGPHLYFSEHQTIWRSMRRAIDGDPDGLWWRTFIDLQEERTTAEASRLLGVLEWLPFLAVDDSPKGCLLFMLSFKSLQRCTTSRQDISAHQKEVTRLWRAPATRYTPGEKLRLLGLDPIDPGMDIPA